MAELKVAKELLEQALQLPPAARIRSVHNDDFDLQVVVLVVDHPDWPEGPCEAAVTREQVKWHVSPYGSENQR